MANVFPVATVTTGPLLAEACLAIKPFIGQLGTLLKNSIFGQNGHLPQTAKFDLRQVASEVNFGDESGVVFSLDVTDTTYQRVRTAIEALSNSRILHISGCLNTIECRFQLPANKWRAIRYQLIFIFSEVTVDAHTTFDTVSRIEAEVERLLQIDCPKSSLAYYRQLITSGVMDRDNVDQLHSLELSFNNNGLLPPPISLPEKLSE